jgi:hypothetical protein
MPICIGCGHNRIINKRDICVDCVDQVKRDDILSGDFDKRSNHERNDEGEFNGMAHLWNAD